MTLFSILVDLNNTVLCIVSICRPITNSLNPVSNPLGTVPSTIIGIITTLIFNSSLSFLSKCLSPFLFSLISTLWSTRLAKSTLQQVSFFVNYHLVWSLGRDLVICVNLKISVNVMRLLLQDGFWFVCEPFGRMVKFQFFAQLPVDNLSHPVVCCLKLLFR